MESGAGTRAKGTRGAAGGTRAKSARGSARDETETTERPREDEGEDYGTLVAAALIGATVGAGLGLLASRMLDDDMAVMVRTARKRVRRGVRQGVKSAGAIGSSAGEAIGDARGAVGDFASRAREAFEDVLQREVRQLRKAARRQRRRLGF
jgi:hypothetical protein